jgi:polyisoprenoid-binding protein YceI
MRYEIQRGKIVVRGRAPDDHRTATWSNTSGTFEVDVDDPGRAGGEMTVDLRTFEAGDWFAKSQLKSIVAAAAHPKATFVLMRVEKARELVAGQVEGVAVGQIQWRDHTVTVRARGGGTLNHRALDVSGRFVLDVRQLGVPVHAGDAEVVVDVSVYAIA